jgi:hypothetical protein
MSTSRMSLSKRYGFLWITLAFFLLSIIGHWTFAWYDYVQEQLSDGKPVETLEFFVRTSKETLENWQSEFLQLIWQVAGLALLLYVGSPQSKEGDDRKEEKIDRLLEKLHPEGKKVIAELDKKYPR